MQGTDFWAEGSETCAKSRAWDSGLLVFLLEYLEECLSIKCLGNFLLSLAG